LNKDRRLIGRQSGQLTGQVAIVTGASSGIGAAVAHALGRRGVHLVLAARRRERIEALAKALSTTYGVRACAVQTDMSQRAQVLALVQYTLAYFGRIDILVNNAGLGLQGDVADLPPDDVRFVFDVNVFGALDAMQAVIPVMHDQQGGVIVNIGSIVSKVAVPSLGKVGSSAAYTASKFALYAFSSVARMELAADKIRVVTMLPGVTESEFNASSLRPAGVERPVRRERSLMGVVPAEKVAERTVLAIVRGEREVYITLKDRLFVWAANTFPGLFAWAVTILREIRLRNI
jgi:uncharacterized protein